VEAEENSLTAERQEVVERTMTLVTECAPIQEIVVTKSSRLVEDLGYHSLALVELGVALEDEFGLDPITADDVEQVVNVGQLVEFVCSRVVA
jgi:acyl carrier protein